MVLNTPLGWSFSFFLFPSKLCFPVFCFHFQIYFLAVDLILLPVRHFHYIFYIYIYVDSLILINFLFWDHSFRAFAKYSEKLIQMVQKSLFYITRIILFSSFPFPLFFTVFDIVCSRRVYCLFSVRINFVYENSCSIKT